MAGGLVAISPSEKGWLHPELGALLDEYLHGRDRVATEDRKRMLRLIESMTMGRNAVGDLTESLHGAASPQAQRVQRRRAMDVATRTGIAKRLTGIEEGS